MKASAQGETYIDTAVKALTGEEPCLPVLDQLPVPAYTTDADGTLTYWNRACVDFAGREPRSGVDKWCVTWKILSTTGKPVPHEACPMADAIRQKREVRGQVAIALRPDGTRRAFVPYPTPLFDNDGELIGGVNVLIDVTEQQSSDLAEQAGRCRRLASATYDRETSSVLAALAEDYDQTAVQLRGKAV